MTKESKQFVEDNMGLFYQFCHDHKIYDEDCKQDLVLALCKAAKEYDPTMAKPSTYIHKVLSNELNNIIKFNNRLCRKGDMTKLSLDYVYDANEENNTIADYIATPDYIVDSIKEKEFLIAIDELLDKCKRHKGSSKSQFRKLTDKEIDIFHRRMNDESMKEIGDIYGISQQRIFTLVTSIIQQIKEEVYSWYE